MNNYRLFLCWTFWFDAKWVVGSSLARHPSAAVRSVPSWDRLPIPPQPLHHRTEPAKPQCHDSCSWYFKTASGGFAYEIKFLAVSHVTRETACLSADWIIIMKQSSFYCKSTQVINRNNTQLKYWLTPSKKCPQVFTEMWKNSLGQCSAIIRIKKGNKKSFFFECLIHPIY